jgi:MoaD family protein
VSEVPVRVKVPTLLRTQVDGLAVVEADGGGTLGEVLDHLDARYPGMKARIVTEDGSLHRFVNVYVNGEDARFLGSLDAPVAEGDTISILPAVAGGA